MNKNEIWKLAISSGLCDPNLSNSHQLVTDFGDATEAVENFATLIDAQAREDCARLCDAKAKMLSERADKCEDADDATEIKALAWQLTVTAAEIRTRSNV